MKKYLLLAIILTLSMGAFSQTQVSSKITKDIEIEKDDFAGGLKYSSKKTGLSVISKQNECLFTWELTCLDLVPISFNKVQLLANGNIENIAFLESEYTEYAETVRVPRNTFSGTKMATTYINENRYIAKITIDASKHLPLLESIISDPKDTKIRFSGNKDVDGVFDKKKKAEIKTLLLIPNHYYLL